MEEGVGVINLILVVVELLKRDINKLVVSAQDDVLIKLVKLQDKRQLNYINKFRNIKIKKYKNVVY